MKNAVLFLLGLLIACPYFVKANSAGNNPITGSPVTSKGVNSTSVSPLPPPCAATFDWWLNTVASSKASAVISLNSGSNIVQNKRIYYTLDFVIDANITFEGCEFIMYNDVDINIQSGYTLTIKDYTSGMWGVISTIYAQCDRMWGSINVPAGANLDMDNVHVDDGQIAVHSNNGGFCNIRRCVFDQNYTAIKIENGGNYTGSFWGNTFKCSSNISLPPYSGQVCESGISVRNTTNANIGDVTQTANVFTGVQTSGSTRGLTSGIKADASGVTVYNNTFTYCYNGVNYFNGGTGDPLVTIGSTTSSAYANTFNDCFFGNYIANRCTLNIKNNTYGAGAAAKAFFGIYVTDNIYKAVDNNRNTIQLNTLNNQRNGIYVGNVSANPTYTTIDDNDIIQLTGAYINLRKGIQLNSLMDDIYVTNNVIDYSSSVTNTNVSSCSPIDFFDDCNRWGIYVSDCTEPNIEDNRILRNVTPNSGTVDKLVGILTEYGPTATLKENYMKGTGSGIYGNATNANIKYQCNTMENCYNMFRFNTAILAQQGQAISVPWDNRWLTNAGGTTGTYNSSGTPINWYIRNTDVVGNQYNIKPLSVLPNTKIVPLYSQNGTAICTPPARYSEPLNDPMQNDEGTADYVNMVAQNQIDYINYIPQSRYWDLTIAYRLAKADSTMRDEDIGNEGNINVFYNQTKDSNIGYIDALNNYAANTDAAGFDSLNNAWQPQNQMEEYRKTVNTIYAASVLSGRVDLTQDEVDVLMPIALLNPIEAGDAVFSARAMLHMPANDYTMNDDQGGVEKIANPDKALISLYPNPANTEFNISYNLGDNTSALFELVDMDGTRVDAFNLNGKTGLQTYNTEKLKAGVYLYRVSNAAGAIDTGKLVIIKN